MLGNIHNSINSIAVKRFKPQLDMLVNLFNTYYAPRKVDIIEMDFPSKEKIVYQDKFQVAVLN